MAVPTVLQRDFRTLEYSCAHSAKLEEKMPISLVPVEILSIYFDKDKQRVNLFKRLAQCTPDTKAAVMNVKAELDAKGVKLFLSDMFRSHDMQLQAHVENAKK